MNLQFGEAMGQPRQAHIRIYIFSSPVESSTPPDASSSLDMNALESLVAATQLELAVDNHSFNVGSFDPSRITVNALRR
jgi:hypothetical protein